VKVEVSLGEVVDKASILEIKSQRIHDPAKLVNVRAELEALHADWAVAGYPPMSSLDDWAALMEVNERLWVVEDDLRDLERAQDFGDRFVALARSVYRINDERAAVKRRINVKLGSRLIEEKSYADYRPAS
jgi:hypothetical protein